MKTSVALILLPGLLLTGCGRTASPPPTIAPSAARPLPSLTALADAPPPPGMGPVAALAAPRRASEPEVPTYEGANEAEKLTWALRDYYTRHGAAAPAVSSLDALVKARLLKSVPAPPPGKQFVIDMKSVEVRLQDR